MPELRVDFGRLGRAWRLAPWALLALGAAAAFGQGPPVAPPPPSALQVPEQEMVVDVKIVGQRTIPLQKITPHVRTRSGRPFDPQLIEEDVRRLNRSKLFISVKPSYQRAPGGRVVIFEVVERPILHDVLYAGNEKIHKNVLAKQTNLKPGDSLDPFTVEEARKKLEEFYQQKGYADARVTLLEGDKPTDTRAVFLINEGRPQKVLWIRFVGNTIASDARLRTQIHSKTPLLWLFSGGVDRKQIEEDVDRLTAYYRGLGFFRARIGKELEFDEKQNWLVLTFVIDEGPRYKLRNLSFVGNTKIPTEQLQEDLKVKAGDYFNQAKMASDIAKLQEKYGSIGYVFADVKADPRFLEEPGQLDLVYNFKEGDRYRVGRIIPEIKGEYPHTRMSTMLNLVTLKPGDIVDIRKIRDSEKRLRASQLFQVDPMSGEVPRIVISPPDSEGEQAVADRPRPRSRHRSQSPDPPQPYEGGWPPAGYSREREIDLTVLGRADPQARQRWEALPVAAEQSSPLRRRVFTAGLPGEDAGAKRMSGSSQPPRIVLTQYTTELAPTAPPARPLLPSLRNPPRWAGTAEAPPGFPGGAAPAAPGGAAAPVPFEAGPPLRPGGTPWAAGQPGPPAGPPLDLGAPILPPVDDDERVFTRPMPPGTRPLDIPVRGTETQTGRLMLGVGINSDAGLVGSVVFDEQNFDILRFPHSFQEIVNATAWRGAGQRFRIEAVPGTRVQRYMANFQEPYLFNTDVSLGLSGFYYDRIFREWDEQRIGGRVATGYHFTHHLAGSLSFRGEKVNVRNPIYPPGILPELDEVVGDNTLLGFGTVLAHDTRDSPFLATEGHLIEMSFEYVIGSFQYPRVDLDLRRYFLLHERPDGSGRHVLSLMGRMGVGGADMPLYDHYFAGGFSTIRGFSFRGVSPESAGVLVGGHFSLLASAEYMFPITADDMLRAVVFCDTGTVEPSINNWSDRYRVAPGFGFRITIPAMGPAPIAFDFAFPVSYVGTDRREVFSFFLGVLR